MDLRPMTGADVDRAPRPGLASAAATVGFARSLRARLIGQAQSIRLAVAEEHRCDVANRAGTAAVEAV